VREVSQARRGRSRTGRGTRRLRVGIVGTGIGRAHVEAYRTLPELFEVAAVCDVDAERARTAAADYEIPRVVTEFAELCALDGLDVVDICTPPYLHASQTIQALEAGRHVICEKPLAGSLRDADHVATTEKRSGRRVMPVFQYRFGHGAQKLKLLLERGITGPAYLTTVETAWRRRPPYYAVPWRGRWATELGGPLVNLAIHAHDLVYYLLGSARRVYASVTTRVNTIETEDCAVASLEMEDGSLCTLSVTTGSAREISRHRFCFANLSAESNTEAYRSTHDPWTFTGDSPEIDARIEKALAGFAPMPEGFAGQFLRFHRALHADTELPVTVADARAALELITAMYQAAGTREPVQLPLSAAHPLYRGWQPARTPNGRGRARGAGSLTPPGNRRRRGPDRGRA
jgi:predicted dehydrogenase